MTDIVIALVGGCLGLLQGLIIYILSGQGKKIESICRDNREDHKELRENNRNLETKVSTCEHRITIVEARVLQ